MRAERNERLTKKYALLTATLCATLLLSCGAQRNGNQQETALARIQESGVMRVGYLVWPPAVIRGASEADLSGIYPDMINQMAQLLNVKVEWEETSLANFSAGLNSRQFDFSVGPTFVTIPRATAVSFTQPIAYVGNSGVVRLIWGLPSYADRRPRCPGGENCSPPRASAGRVLPPKIA